MRKILRALLAATLFALLCGSAFGANPHDSSGFVELAEAVPDAILEIRYYSTYNFVGDRINGYEEPCALLTKEAAKALRAVSDELVQKGYRLKIYDAYRPQRAVTHFMNWAKDTGDTRMKKYFYPTLDKSVLFAQGYIAAKSGHSRGSTVDLTLFDMNTEKEVDMGGTFDHFGRESHPDYKGVTEEQYANRMVLREAMLAHGFKPLAEEWWHFTLKNEPYPDTYFDFPVKALKKAHRAPKSEAPLSPKWISGLKAAKGAEQLVIVSGTKGSNAEFSMHEKDEDGRWHQVLSAPAFIGKNGWGKTKEGDGKSPIGVFHFTMAFGINEDPGCPIGYTQVDDTHYWNGDSKSKGYNQFVSTRDDDSFSKKDSEHIIDYDLAYPYVLNISYNENGTPGRGSAIFLHCYTKNHYTGGCVAIPEKVMVEVLKRVKEGCVVVMDKGKRVREY